MTKRFRLNGKSIVWTLFGCSMFIATLPTGGEGGLSGSGIFSGRIQRFGSIFMNDVELDTSFTTILVNGISVGQDDLRIGQQLRTVTLDEQADQVTYRSTLIAPIDEIVNGNTLTVLGQQVQLFVGTNTEGIALEDLEVDDWVEISGVRDPSRTVLATFLRRHNLPQAARLVGRLDTTPTGVELSVDGVTVDANLATVIPPLAELMDGDELEIVGTLKGSELQADSVFRIEPLSIDGQDYVDVVGFVDSRNGDRFTVDGVSANLNPGTVFVNGSAVQIVPGVRLEVEGGELNGEISALRVLFKPIREVEIHAPLQLISAIEHRITLLDIDILVTGATKFGRSSSPEFNASAFENLGELAPDEFLRVRAFVDGENVVAARIDRVKPQSKVRLTGLVSSKGILDFNVLGAQIQGSADTGFKVAGQEVTQAEFQSALQVGDFVQVRWKDFEMVSEPPDDVELH